MDWKERIGLSTYHYVFNKEVDEYLQINGFKYFDFIHPRIAEGGPCLRFRERQGSEILTISLNSNEIRYEILRDNAPNQLVAREKIETSIATMDDIDDLLNRLVQKEKQNV